MRHRARRGSAVALIGAVLAGRGCGGGSEPAPTAVAGASQTAPAPALAPAPAPAPAPASPAAAAPATPTVATRTVATVPAETAARSAEGLWIGTAGSDVLTGVVLGDGPFWLTHHRDGVIQRVVRGTSRTASGRFSSTDARVLDGAVGANSAVSGEFVARQRFSGVIAGTGASGMPFEATYSSSYASPAQAATVAGNWASTLKGGATSQVTIAANGLLSGTDSAGCAFTGYLLPRSSGTNVYARTIAFGAAPCALAGRSTSGVAYFVPGGAGTSLVMAVADDEAAGGFGAMFSRSSVAAPATGRTISGAELLTVLKGYAVREVFVRGGPPGGMLFLSFDGSARYGGPTPSPGNLHAWSQLMWGGQGTVSYMGSTLAGRSWMNIEFLTSSGSSGYIANMTLTSGGDRIGFDEVHTIDERDRIPIDREVFTWRRNWGSGSALVRLIVQSIDGSPPGFRVCWLTQYGALNRLACTVHGRDYAAYVVDDHFGNVQRQISTIGHVPWRADPPAGTPAPAPNPNLLRYAYGSGVTNLLATPLASAGVPDGTSVTVRDAAGRGGTLNASTRAQSPVGTTSFASAVDGNRSAGVSYTDACAPSSACRGRCRAWSSTPRATGSCSRGRGNWPRARSTRWTSRCSMRAAAGRGLRRSCSRSPGSAGATGCTG